MLRGSQPPRRALQTLQRTRSLGGGEHRKRQLTQPVQLRIERIEDLDDVVTTARTMPEILRTPTDMNCRHVTIETTVTQGIRSNQRCSGIWKIHGYRERPETLKVLPAQALTSSSSPTAVYRRPATDPTRRFTLLPQHLYIAFSRAALPARSGRARFAPAYPTAHANPHVVTTRPRATPWARWAMPNV